MYTNKRYSSDRGNLVQIAIYAILFPLVFFVWPPIGGAMTNDAKATGALEQLGFREVRIIEKDVYFVALKGCGRDDSALYTLEAVNPMTGKRGTFYVCAGVWKGGTVRS